MARRTNFARRSRATGGPRSPCTRRATRSRPGVAYHVGEAAVDAQGAGFEGFVELGNEKLGAVCEKVLTARLNALLCEKQQLWNRFCSGARKGIKFHKYLCKAQDSMEKLPLERFLHVDLTVSFPPSFHYSMKIQGSVLTLGCQSDEQHFWVAPAAASTTLVPSHP